VTRKKEPEPTQTYGVVATHPIDLPGGREGVPGQQVTLAAEDAAPLLADGHLVPIEPNLSDPVETATK